MSGGSCRMDVVPSNPHLTPEEYFEIDRDSESKYEYMFGEMIKVQGGSPRHSLITANTCIALGRRLAGGACRVFDSSLRVCLDRTMSFYVYPDLTVVEGPLEYLEDRDETVANPRVVVEVLSPVMRNLELGDKARMYTRVPSLTDLLMIEQDGIGVEHWVRRAGDHWYVALLKDRDAIVGIESIHCEIPLAEIYVGVDGLI
jgi:Uma2 family endonuclease